MNTDVKTLISSLAKIIDKDKYNPLLTSRNYDKYLEKILTAFVEECFMLEAKKETKK